MSPVSATTILNLGAVKAPPERAVVLRSQGVPSGAVVPGRISRLVDAARVLYGELAEPRGLIEEVSGPEFEQIYLGEGKNAHTTPLEVIFPRAAHLALFVVTLGDAVSDRIGRLFDENDPALGCVLDSIASERSDTAADLARVLYLSG